MAETDLISGVFNYCDRWCERCPFTSRCAVSVAEEERAPSPEERDITNQRFWDSLHEILRTTVEMIRKEAEVRGVDLDSLELTDEEREKQEERREQARSHDCPRLAKDYSEMVEQWFRSAEGLFKEKGRELETVARLELPGRSPQDELAGLNDTIEVIRWYQHPIHVKLVRAFWGKAEDDPELREILEEFPKDCDGSAKVALLGMDRSIAAWGAMMRHFPEREDDILDILIHLDRLRKMTEKEFSAARAFVRPGFDEAH